MDEKIDDKVEDKIESKVEDIIEDNFVEKDEGIKVEVKIHGRVDDKCHGKV